MNEGQSPTVSSTIAECVFFRKYLKRNGISKANSMYSVLDYFSVFVFCFSGQSPGGNSPKGLVHIMDLPHHEPRYSVIRLVPLLEGLLPSTSSFQTTENPFYPLPLLPEA